MQPNDLNANYWDRLEDLFARAAPLPEAEQNELVSSEAADDPALAAQLLSLLRSDRNTSFLDAGIRPAADQLITGPVSDRIGPYKIKGSLGEGGMGVVYLAEHSEWHSPVAIKVPRDAWISPDRKDRFAAEQRVLAQLTHPAIARIYDAGTGANGTPWFAMEFVEGEPITVFAGRRNLSIPERLKLFRQACEAVQYAHSQAIIHRDLKPSNIFVSRAGQVKLLDFGIARQVEENNFATRTGGQPFTMAYAAPEQIGANKVSVQSDIYSLGVTLYELIAERLPLDVSGLTPVDAANLLDTRLPEKPSAVSGLHLKRSEWADLDLLIVKTLHKDPARRYGSVDALIRDIDHFLNQEALDARPDSVRYRLSKFVRKRRLPLLAAAAVMAVIISLVGYFTWQLAKTRDEAVEQARREGQIQQFMTDLFEGGDDVNGPSKDLRVIDMLAAGVTKARQFDGDPLVQGDLYSTLGTVYQSIGEFGKAEKLLDLALARLTAATGPQSKQVAETLAYIAMLQDDRGEYSKADANARKAVKIAQKLRPAQPMLTAEYQTALGRVLSDETRYADALNVLESAAPKEHSLPESRKIWLDNMNLQSNANLKLHRYAEAERQTRFLIATDRQQHPVLKPSDAQDVLQLGEIQEALGQYPAAESSYREGLRILGSWDAQGHPEVGAAQRGLSQILEKEGKYQEATVLARAALTGLEQTYGARHRRVAYALRNLFLLACDRKDFKEARQDVTREIAIYKQIGNTADLPTALTNLAFVDMKEKDYRQAETLCREAIARFPSTEWAGGVGMAHAELMLGEIKLKQKRYSDAEAPLLDSLALYKKQPYVPGDKVRETISRLIETYEGLGEPAKAATYRTELAKITGASKG